LRVNPKYENRSTPQDTLLWKQYQMTEIQITKTSFVYNAEPFAALEDKLREASCFRLGDSSLAGRSIGMTRMTVLLSVLVI
jgi:hypothetical protein